MHYRLDPHRPRGDELARVATACLDDAVARLAGLHDASTHDPQAIEAAVHETRKRGKELRGLAQLVRPVVGKRRFRVVDRAVRDAGRELSTLRDAHALLGAVTDLQAGLDEHEAAALEPARAVLAGHAAATTRALSGGDPRIARALDHLAQARRGVDAWHLPRDVAVEDLGLRRTYRRGRKRLGVVERSPDDEAVHRWRKAVKQLWYQTRLLEPAFPDRLGPTVDDLDQLSDLLGDDHDLAVLVERLDATTPRELSRHARLEAVQLARRRQAVLRHNALRLGHRAYALGPSAFVPQERER